jgi:hypothetical protein
MYLGLLHHVLLLMKFRPKEFCVIPNCFNGHKVVESLYLNINFHFIHL